MIIIFDESFNNMKDLQPTSWLNVENNSSGILSSNWMRRNSRWNQLNLSRNLKFVNSSLPSNFGVANSCKIHRLLSIENVRCSNFYLLLFHCAFAILGKQFFQKVSHQLIAIFNLTDSIDDKLWYMFVLHAHKFHCQAVNNKKNIEWWENLKCSTDFLTFSSFLLSSSSVS